MKYSELKERQAKALTSFYLAIIAVKSREEQEYSKSGLQLLVVGNSGGIALLGAFMLNLAARGESYRPYVAPLALFVLGAILASLMYVPLIAVANGAVSHLGNSLEKFFKDELSAEQLQSYGFNAVGRIVLLILLVGSIGSFFTAVVWTLVSLLRI
jgi:hypothetical protein